jgi:transcription initiation factor TFIID subunit TAF12
VHLWLGVIAYNLGDLWRRLALPRRTGNWSLMSLHQRLVKTGGRLVPPFAGCALLQAAAGRRASHPGVFWQHASKGHGAAAAGRVPNQERQRTERSEATQSGQVPAARQVGGEK